MKQNGSCPNLNFFVQLTAPVSLPHTNARQPDRQADFYDEVLTSDVRHVPRVQRPFSGTPFLRSGGRELHGSFESAEGSGGERKVRFSGEIQIPKKRFGRRTVLTFCKARSPSFQQKHEVPRVGAVRSSPPSGLRWLRQASYKANVEMLSGNSLIGTLGRCQSENATSLGGQITLFFKTTYCCSGTSCSLTPLSTCTA